MNELKTEISDFDKEIELIMSGDKGLSYSALSAFLNSPKHYYEYKTSKETTPAMEEGKMFHLACLELDKFHEKYWVLDDTEKVNDLLANGYLDSKGKLLIPTNPRAVKPYKEWVIQQELLHKGQERISKEDYDTYIRMSEALRKNKASGILMNNLVAKEEPFEMFIDEFKFTGKIDGRGEIKHEIDENNIMNLLIGDKYQVDLKKVANAAYEKIKWDIKRMKYHMQGGIYSKAKNIDNYFLIYIDKSCNITVVKLDRTTLDEGYQMAETATAEFSRCAEENDWNSSYEFHNGGYINF